MKHDKKNITAMVTGMVSIQRFAYDNEPTNNPQYHLYIFQEHRRSTDYHKQLSLEQK